jgi:hypothetical protein
LNTASTAANAHADIETDNEPVKSGVHSLKLHNSSSGTKTEPPKEGVPGHGGTENQHDSAVDTGFQFLVDAVSSRAHA